MSSKRDANMRSALTQDILRHGLPTPAPAPARLTAGHVRVSLDEVDLRGLGTTGSVLLDRVYVAVRDRDWNTVPAVISDLEIGLSGSGFEVTFEARHAAADIDYAWSGEISGGADGVIRYKMAGQARSAFRYCRIGFCVLHPDTFEGGSYVARTPAGSVSGPMPRLAVPQLIVDGIEQALFPSCESLVVEAPDGRRVRTDFSGDLFEMEDQRNWTDASFKTYCTPMALGYPHAASEGDRFEQTVTIHVEEAARSARSSQADPAVALDLAAGDGRSLPGVGLGSASDGAPLTASERASIRDLKLDHLRVDVHPARRHWRDELDEAIGLASELDVELEVALYVPSPSGTAVEDVSTAVADTRVARWLVFDEKTAGTDTTPVGVVAQARATLGETAVIAGGTDGDFAELNRARPDPSTLDAIIYSINPRVHTADDRSLMENSTAQGVTVRTARSFSGERSICVSPVTLAQRFNPAASGPEESPEQGQLPHQVDVRQLSLLGAAWTVSSISDLAMAGAASVTYFETAGWRGVVGREAGSPLPSRFPSTPGWAFPVYHVIAHLGDMRPGKLLTSISSARRSLAGLATRRDGRVIGMAANLTSDELSVAIGPFDRPVRTRTLDETTALEAGRDPSGFRDSAATVDPEVGQIRMLLLPYASVMFETV